MNLHSKRVSEVIRVVRDSGNMGGELKEHGVCYAVFRNKFQKMSGTYDECSWRLSESEAFNRRFPATFCGVLVEHAGGRTWG